MHAELFSRTKIVCTIGPAVNSMERLIQLQQAGMNVARLNFSHGDHAQHKKTIDLLKKVREKTGIPLAIMLDTKGPELRIGKLKTDRIELRAQQRIQLCAEEIEGDDQQVSLLPGSALKDLKEGTQVLIDDGYIEAHVVAVEEGRVTLEIDNPGVLKPSKGVNVPGVKLSLPAVTEKDIEDIRLGCQENVDILAASFIRTREQVLEIRQLLYQHGATKTRLYAKIENKEGVDNFEEILGEVDGIIIARGDLGVEIPLSRVPSLQKRMIRMACSQGKPTLTATQMLESMIYNPRPTRAEASDVANAIFDSSSAVMLSGETAMGKYPIQAVKTMKEIICEAEAEFDYESFYQSYRHQVVDDIPAAIALATVKTASRTSAKAIFCFTTSGFTARCISRVRPSIPIIALTSDEQVYQQLASNWGIYPIYAKSVRSIEAAYALSSEVALREGFVQVGDLVLIVAGAPFGVPGSANMMLIESIGDVIFRGQGGCGKIVQGKLHVVNTDLSQESLADVEQRIVLLRECKPEHSEALKRVKGVLLCNEVNDCTSPQVAKDLAKEHGFSLVYGVNMSLAPDVGSGKWVTLDPENRILFENYFHEGRDSLISHPLS